ncbi:MAG: transcription-repair coupling factor [Bacteroidales bacterium]|nr:transcription-repair coupling factor [Candidatus Latescibacterota bacterium]
MWDYLKDRIAGLPAFEGLEKRLEQDSGRIPVAGLAGSSQALVLSTLLRGKHGPVIVITTDPVSARDMEWELSSFGVEKVVAYPEDEILPYDYHDPDRNLTGMQMTALESVLDGSCEVLVCTMRSLLKKIFAPRLFRSLVFEVEQDREYDIYELADRLVQLGYERHEIVEAKGHFAIRGAILDIFEVGSPDPVRIEFDGDSAFSLRDFDVETQRSTDPRSSVRIRPFHHIAPDAEGLAKLRDFLAGIPEEFDREERARMMVVAERLESGLHFYGMEHYAAVVHDVVPIFEYFRQAPMIVTCCDEDIRRGLEEFREEIKVRYESSREKEHYYPEPDRVYLSESGLEDAMSGFKRIEMVKVPVSGAVRFFSASTGDFRRNFKGLESRIRKETENGMQVFLFCSSKVQKDRAEDVFEEVSLEMDFPEGFISGGFRWEDAGVLFLSEDEVFGRFHRPYHSPLSRNRSLSYDPAHFQPGDFVVHISHGIGRYMGMRMLEVEGGKTECLDMRYEGDDRLFIPVSKLRMVEKYMAADGVAPKLAALGSKAWKRAKEKAKKSASLIAGDLLEIYAARQVAKGFACGPDKPWQNEMEASFPWEETPHQLQATSEVKNDLEAIKPMDRLLCGDVGFGKTEVAIRAVFKVIMEGKQAAFLVPTTVLALQHLSTLKERLAGFPVRVEMLSRFVSTSKQKELAVELGEGKIDIVIGTHRLLSKDISFANLGLVVVDEEHRFGVKHKERFKKMKKSVDVLSMTATPIPRTLSMALSGIRDISVIDTPPRNRLPIQTEILPFDDEKIREAVMREINRGGQVFFVHNRVQSIQVMEGYLRRLLPEKVKIAHAHGQMKEKELEKIMIDFLERKFDLLLCTMIIEAGLDFPNVNTIIINRSDRFGLAQLYQLRGRVGRSDRKAYAFMLIPKGRTLTATAIRRLQAISEFDYLGAGYRIAMRDLEIRGAGNLLGHQQSGQINAVGLDLYSRMIREEVSRIKGEPVEEEREMKIAVPLAAYLPSGYITDSEERMELYRKLSRVREREEAEVVGEELVDRFGSMPEVAGNMLKIVEWRARAMKAGLEAVDVTPRGILRVHFSPGNIPGRKPIAEIAGLFEGRLTFHTENGFSMSVRPDGERPDPGREVADVPVGEATGTGWQDMLSLLDLESLLNLLENYVN